MPLEVVLKPAFARDLFALPQDVLRRIETAIRHIAADPVSAAGHAERCFKHLYKNLYRYKLKKDYRLIYAVGDGCVCLLGIERRDRVYDRFQLETGFQPPTRPDTASAEPQIIPTTAYDTYRSVGAPDLIPTGEPGAPAENPDDAVRDVNAAYADRPTDATTDEHDPADDAMDDGDALNAATSEEDPPVNGAITATDPAPAELLRDLLELWGVDGPHRESILACRSVDELLELDIPDEIKERVLHLTHPPTLGRILEQPTLELKDAADLDRYVAGELKQFLLKLDPDQERAAARALRGPVLVKGGPGTGKSLVALYRIKNLLETSAQHQLFASERPRILLLTYTRSLINVCQELLEELLGRLPDEVHVTNLDRKVREIVTGAGHDFQPAEKEDKLRCLEQALEGFAPPGGPAQRAALQRALGGLRRDYILSEFDWVIEGRGLQTLDVYLAEDRTGRGIGLDADMRRTLWELHQRYLAALRARGMATWDIYRLQAEQLLRTRFPEERYDVVIVDEAQDLTPAALRVCVALARRPAGLYLTADASQSIYSRGFSWHRVHEDLRVRGRTLVLRRNYRTTQQIAEAAAQLLRDHGGGDPEVLQVNAVRWGPKPVLLPCRNGEHEVKAIAEFLRKAARDTQLPVGTGAVLVRTNRDAAEIAQALSQQGIPAQHMRSTDMTLETRHVRVLTIHTAKGLEFPFVAVARVNAGVLPLIPSDLSPGELEEQLAAERRLLFVALSRAMRRLLVTYNEAQPSRFIRELDPSLWRHGLE